MSGEKKRAVPRLRFPEFRDMPGWEEKRLKNVCYLKAGNFVPASKVDKRSDTNLYLCFGGNGLRGYTNTYTHSGRYSLIGRQGALCGNITFVEGKFHATKHAVVVTPKEEVETNWLFYELVKLNSNQYATGQALPGLPVKDLENILIKFPENRKEQQKIADCLASIDAVIAAQGRKVEQLERHKKALLQQLFPCEGDTTPRLCFPEFQSAPAWEEKRLGDFLTPYSEKAPATCAEFPIYSSTRNGLVLQSQYYSSREVLNDGEYGVVPRGMFVYRHMSDDNTFKFNINDIEDKIAVSKEYPVFFTTNLDSHFLLYLLNESFWFKEFAAKQKKGGTRTRLYFKTLCSWNVSLPPFPEQQKIANCLSSIDNLIDLHRRKLAALKRHKKGLMQQLFPSLDEVQR